ncbi:S8 family serine peptidase [Porphyromonas levii]|uniref:S8 family serine peptidase n=1 Tax=Porphyromonas levii TaxID=28114 RepID=UPI000380446B|nr:S8 family serine peptidase [Porphyromonas levii]MBR8713720.1 hypothetical protein [Porphyromonas levii]MBR8715714.1 hypothetical protein [Porphyromonas levii]MBR8728281.1 hypothetical protein [Porphyromonas levii]MBR8736385.1 hypothetical protein [Porphyromonas levii]MBR8774450.1 hypothetical protein [Porphyromonas levii]
MKKSILAAGCLLCGLAMLVGSCTKERRLLEEPSNSTEANQRPDPSKYDIPAEGAVPGQVFIRVSEATASSLRVTGGGDVDLQALSVELSATLRSIDGVRMHRVFPPAGKFEARRRAEGLHLYYYVHFDEEIPLPQAMAALDQVPEVAMVEFVPVIQPMGDGQPFSLRSGAGSYLDVIQTNPLPSMERKSDMPFDDPLLPQQWHYNNDGTVPGSTMGADINLFKAWKITTGTPNVIVNIVDTGVDLNHPDLKDNIWVNSAEANGTPGVDDDNNGYVDDVHGWCFVTNSPNIKGEMHGTHVAGTVAARNNNGIGVSGVAGGNHAKGSQTGVRLMSTAILRTELNDEGKEVTKGGNQAEAIVYAADNGAVISQNSWGWPSYASIKTTPEPIKKAIAYFNKYAGIDKDTHTQRPESPMAGGIIFFAAGNEPKEFTAVPASEPEVIAVAAYGPSYQVATFSTYGPWVDIMAPGGDLKRNGHRGGVMSTIPAINGSYANAYDAYDGTSMACPHASGIAALVLSHRGKMGYTAKQLRQTIMAATTPVNVDKLNPDKSGKLGIGMIDAYLALTLDNQNKAPKQPIIDLPQPVEQDYTSLVVEWLVPEDEDDGQPAYYILLTSRTALTAQNLLDKGKLIGPPNNKINGKDTKAGDRMTWTIPLLKPGEEHFFALIAVDRWGNRSEPVFFSRKTKENSAPEITNIPTEPLKVVNASGPATYELMVEEVDGHSWKVESAGTLTGVTLYQRQDKIEVVLRSALPQGEYTFTLTLTDQLGAVSSYEIPFVVVRATKPLVIQSIPDQLVGKREEPIVFDLTQFVDHNPYLQHEYTVRSMDPNTAIAQVEGSKISIKGLRQGQTTISVNVSNGFYSTTINLLVSVIEDTEADVHAIWPLPAKKFINIWLNAKHKQAEVVIRSEMGEQLSKQVLTSQDDGQGNGFVVLDVNSLPYGTYILEVVTGGRRTEQIFLKM